MTDLGKLRGRNGLECARGLTTTVQCCAGRVREVAVIGRKSWESCECRHRLTFASLCGAQGPAIVGVCCT